MGQKRQKIHLSFEDSETGISATLPAGLHSLIRVSNRFPRVEQKHSDPPHPALQLYQIVACNRWHNLETLVLDTNCHNLKSDTDNDSKFKSQVT